LREGRCKGRHPTTEPAYQLAAGERLGTAYEQEWNGLLIIAADDNGLLQTYSVLVRVSPLLKTFTIMKNYEVRMTMLVAVTVSVEAENEEAAEKLAMEKTGREEAYYLSKYDSVWEREVVEVNETGESERTELDDALDYVREQIGEDELLVYKATVTKNLNHRMPATAGLDDAKVIDLLEEYGADNDMPEGWWENEGDIDDWLLKL